MQWYGLEFIVVCMGKYGDVPIIPKYRKKRGPEVFKGKVMHSQEYNELSRDKSCQLLKGKKVVVVKKGNLVPWLLRLCHWIVPHYFIWGLPFYMFYSTRFSQQRKATSKIIESYLLWKLPLVKYGLKPDHPFEEDYASCQMAILPNSFFMEAEKGNINFKRASNWWFWEGGVEFDDKTKIEADLVILATGYDGKKKLRALLPQQFSTFLEFPSGIMPLYRYVYLFFQGRKLSIIF
ncbi:putative flavin-containing monooxygenase [Helianthus anomalus]